VLYRTHSPGLDGHLAAVELDHHGAAQHDGELAELGALPRLGPAGRTAHPRDAQRRLAGAGPADEFVDQLRRLSGRGHPARFADQFRHAPQYPAPGLARGGTGTGATGHARAPH